MEWLALLNLLLVPAVAVVLRVSRELATLTTLQREHERRLNNLENRVFV